jgi:hypothetical protein
MTGVPEPELPSNPTSFPDLNSSTEFPSLSEAEFKSPSPVPSPSLSDLRNGSPILPNIFNTVFNNADFASPPDSVNKMHSPIVPDISNKKSPLIADDSTNMHINTKSAQKKKNSDASRKQRIGIVDEAGKSARKKNVMLRRKNAALASNGNTEDFEEGAGERIGGLADQISTLDHLIRDLHEEDFDCDL